MKNLIIIAVLAGSAFFSSCVKEYTCDCSVADYEEWYDWTAEYKKADAEAACESTNETVAAFLEGSSCELL